ncbi:IS30 family transposase (plasmid) [Limimaricola variabilis]|uniref:IS30 family transposase n=1 Tax=Limimaricola variabilis TaxID=1492771 RepID=UPI002AC8D8B5|nr:IS30 family transposase [Limimaricola variabilis]WPY96309.1 IS30 family transposase [Limimaricola variabilis]
MAHRELDLRERRLVEDLLQAKMSVASIAARLSRHRSTIYREIQRNRFQDSELPHLSGYYGMLAQKRAAERRHRRRKLIRMTALREAVIDRLKAGWSPEQIAGRLRFEEHRSTICHETIYAFVYSQDGQSQDLARHLPERRRQRKPRYARRPRGPVFPLERAIQNRPDDVNDRSGFGDWEGDLMIFRKELGKANVASLVERKTRYAVLFRNNDRSSKHLMNRLIALLSPLPLSARRSITFDRGLEFNRWRDLRMGMGTEAWFCDPQAPWQKGSVENLNKRARRYLPRDTAIAALSDHAMAEISTQLNATPRRCLGYRTPAEAFAEELRKLDLS